MNEFVTLFKVLFIKNFIASKKNKNGKSYGWGMMIGLGVVFSVVSVIYNLALFYLLNQSGNVSDYPLAFAAFVFFMSFATTVFYSQATLFSEKDHNLLLPMPIHKATLVSVKLLLLYAEELVFSLVIFLPTVIIYGLVSPLFFLTGFLLLLIIPLTSSLFSSLIGFLIAYLTKRFAQFKVVLTVIYVLFFVLIMALVMFVSYGVGNSSGSGDVSMYSGFASSFHNFFFTEWMYQGFIQYQVGYFFLVLGIAILFTAILVFLYSFFYSSFYEALSQNRSIRLKERKDKEKTSKPLLALVKKDVRSIFSSPLVFMNTCSGSLMAFLLSFVVCFTVLSLTPGSEEEAYYFQIIKAMIPSLLFFMVGLSSTTPFCITMENKSFYLIKTMPINKKTYLLSKLLTNWLINGTFALLSSLVYLIFGKYTDPLSIVLLFLYPQLGVLSFGLFGLYVDLKRPKLDWDNFAQVKNSFSVMVYTFVGMGVNILFMGLFVLVYFLFGFIAFSIVSLLVLVLFGSVFAVLLRHPEVLIEKIEA